MRYLLVAASFALCAQAQAQSMYRCGNVYQDRPCAAGMKSRVVGSTGEVQVSAERTAD